MNYEIVGKLIFKEETQHISDRFQKREFVIEVENERNSQWNDFVKVQLIQDRCDLLENIDLNENINVPEYRVEDIPPMPEADDLPF